MPRSSALSGLKVLDLTSLLAAPQVAAALADFGADVVKIEPRSGDALRQIGVQRNGASAAWALVSRNKRSVTLDLDHPEGQRIFQSLVREADILIENLTPSLLERWQCDFASLHADHPRLIVVSVSCYGRSGPKSDHVGAGALAEAFAGFAHMNGEAEGPPLLASIPLADTMVGFSGVIGALLACYWRDRRDGGSGQGQHVDVSMIEPILQLLALPLASLDENAPGPKRSGSRIAGGGPRNRYRCADAHWIAVSGTTDAQVSRLLGLLDRDDEDHRRRFGRSGDRLQAADELDAMVEDWIEAHDREQALMALQAARIPAAPVNDFSQILEDPHFLARASFVDVADPALGNVTLVTPAPRLSSTPGKHAHPGPALGAHNNEVLSEWLSLNDEDIERLRQNQAI